MMDPIADCDLQDFFAWLRIPSVSADPARGGDLHRAAAWAAEYLATSGMHSRLEDTAGGPPLVVAHAPKVARAPTILLYGHYDVQPAVVTDGWTGDPFEPRIIDGMVVARGATDNKGQIFAHLIGLRRALARGPLPLNLTVLLDGEEEVGSPHLRATLRRLREELQCEAVLISDTSMVGPGWPSLCLGLRGICCLEVHVVTAEADVHSGMFGGVLPNAAEILCRLLAEARDPDGSIRISGLLDGLSSPHPEELASWATLPWNEESFVAAARGRTSHGEPGYGALERLWSRPTFEINGFTSGYQGPGSKTIIPAAASAKLSLRLVDTQQPEEIARKVETFLRARCPSGVRLSVDYDHGALPYVLSPQHPLLLAARRALAGAFGRPAALVREGLSIPIVALFRRELRADTLLVGLGLPDSRAHGPDETFPLEHLAAGANLHARLLGELARELTPNLSQVSGAAMRHDFLITKKH